MTTLIERLEPFCHGLGKAILREVAEDYAALQAEVERLKSERDRNLDSIRVNNEIINKKNAELDKLKGAEPVAWMDDFGNAFPLGANKGAGSWMDAHKRTWKPLYAGAAPQAPAPERNFCERCGKRLVEGHIHTCTPPTGEAQG